MWIELSKIISVLHNAVKSLFRKQRNVLLTVRSTCPRSCLTVMRIWTHLNSWRRKIWTNWTSQTRSTEPCSWPLSNFCKSVRVSISYLKYRSEEHTGWFHTLYSCVCLKVTATPSVTDHPVVPRRSFSPPRVTSRRLTPLVTRAVTKATRTLRTVMTAFPIRDSPALLFLISVTRCVFISACVRIFSDIPSDAGRLHSALSVLAFSSLICCPFLIIKSAFSGPEHLSPAVSHALLKVFQLKTDSVEWRFHTCVGTLLSSGFTVKVWNSDHIHVSDERLLWLRQTL